MEAITIHKLNDKLAVSLLELPGFRKLGAVVIKDEQGEKCGTIPVYFSGDYFEHRIVEGGFDKTRDMITKLVRNYMVKHALGTSTGRLNLSVTLRECKKNAMAAAA